MNVNIKKLFTFFLRFLFIHVKSALQNENEIENEELFGFNDPG